MTKTKLILFCIFCCALIISQSSAERRTKNVKNSKKKLPADAPMLKKASGKRTVFLQCDSMFIVLAML